MIAKNDLTSFFKIPNQLLGIISTTLQYTMIQTWQYTNQIWKDWWNAEQWQKPSNIGHQWNFEKFRELELMLIKIPTLVRPHVWSEQFLKVSKVPLLSYYALFFSFPNCKQLKPLCKSWSILKWNQKTQYENFKSYRNSR